MHHRCQSAAWTKAPCLLAHQHHGGDGGAAEDVDAGRYEGQRRDVLVAHAAAVEQPLQWRDDAHEQTCKGRSKHRPIAEAVTAGIQYMLCIVR